MNLYYKIKWKITDAWWNFRRSCQRFKRGYAYSDVWDMDFWFLNTIKPMLIHLKEHGESCPIEFNDRDEWCAILDEMINCLTLMEIKRMNLLALVASKVGNVWRVKTIINPTKL